MRSFGVLGRLGVTVLAVAVLAIAAPAGAVDGFTPGSPGLGDPFFPLAGNGGYDVTNYALRLSYEPATNHLDGTATIRATATQNLSRFDLDLRGFNISRLLVNGQAASFARDGQELVITPAAGLVSGQRQPPGQGDLHLPGHRPRGAHGDGQRRARVAGLDRRQDDL
jgi:hypothetical protein